MFKKSIFRKLYISPCICFLLIGFLFLTFSVNVKAAVSNQPPFQVGIPDLPEISRDLTVQDVARVKNKYLALLSGSYNNDVSDDYIIVLDHTAQTYTYTFTCFNLPELTYNYPTITYRNLGQHQVVYIYDASSGTWTDDLFDGGFVNSFTFYQNYLTSTGAGWVLDMAYEELLDQNGDVFWTKDETENPIGVTPLPDNPSLPMPDIDNITPPTLPQFPGWDSTLTIGENIGNWFVWLGDCVTALFSNLIVNFRRFFINLFNNLYSWIDGLKGAIENGFKNLVANFRSLFSPFFDKVLSFFDLLKIIINNIISIGTVSGEFSIVNIFKYLFVPDPAAIVNILVYYDDIGIIGFSTVSYTAFIGWFNQILATTPAWTFHVPSCTYHGLEIGNFDISFNWFVPYKSYTDTIISIFLVGGYVYWLVTNISNILRGNSNALKDLSPSKPED